MKKCKYCNNNAIGEFITFPDPMQCWWELLCMECSNESAVIAFRPLPVEDRPNDMRDD